MIMARVIKESTDEIRFEEPHPWRLTPTSDVTQFLRALRSLAPVSSVVYFEDTGEKHVTKLLQRLSVSATVRVARGTIFPKPDYYHVPLTTNNMEEIATYLDDHPTGHFCTHCCVYCDRTILLAWYDAFLDDPMYVSRTIDEGKVSRFASAIRSTYSVA
jgi:hypothetical protein